MNYDLSFVMTTTVTCYSWAPSSGDHLFTCGAIYPPPPTIPNLPLLVGLPESDMVRKMCAQAAR